MNNKEIIETHLKTLKPVNLTNTVNNSTYNKYDIAKS